jgi:hypothetical protein
MFMRRTRVLFALIALGGLLGFAAPASADDATLVAYMFGANERPGPGDPDGVGRAVITINDAANTICVATQFANLDPVTGYHIHVAPPESPGPIVIPFSAPTSQNDYQCKVVENEALLDNIAANPQQYYINLHTTAYPGGAIRGQLQPVSSSSSGSGSTTGTA